jgi:hypothetical protein
MVALMVPGISSHKSSFVNVPVAALQLGCAPETR